MTGAPGVFAGGDAVPSERTVTVGVGPRQAGGPQHRRLAARRASAPRRPSTTVADLDMLHLWYFGRRTQRRSSPSSTPRTGSAPSTEVVSGLRRPRRRFEAGRCLSCGNCFECDGCLGACPEDAVIKLGRALRYEFDYDRCTGCGTCDRQCPVHAIEMVPEA